MKRMFYLSGTIFFLALSLLIGFHLGQSNAAAQLGNEAAGMFVVEFTGSAYDGATFYVTASGDIYLEPENGGLFPTCSRIGSIGDGPVVDVTAVYPFTAGKVLTASGNVYVFSPEGNVTYLGNIFSGPVATEPTTWGNLKQKFVK